MEEDTWGFDDAVLVGLGGVAVTRAVSEPLNHFGAASGAGLGFWIGGDSVESPRCIYRQLKWVLKINTSAIGLLFLSFKQQYCRSIGPFFSVLISRVNYINCP